MFYKIFLLLRVKYIGAIGSRCRFLPIICEIYEHLNFRILNGVVFVIMILYIIFYWIIFRMSGYFGNIPLVHITKKMHICKQSVVLSCMDSCNYRCAPPPGQLCRYSSAAG